MSAHQNDRDDVNDQDEALARMFRGAERPIADDGFTDRVMTALPAAPRRGRRMAVIAAFAMAAAIALVLMVPRLGAVMARGLAASASLSAMLAAAAVVAMVLGAGVVAARPE